MEKVVAFLWSFLLVFTPFAGAEELQPEKKEQFIHVTAMTGGVIVTALLYTGRKKYKGIKKDRERKRNL